MEANEKTGLKGADLSESEDKSKVGDEKSALGGLDEVDYKSWNLRLLRFSTGSSEAYRERLRGVEASATNTKTNEVIIEPFGKCRSG